MSQNAIALPAHVWILIIYEVLDSDIVRVENVILSGNVAWDFNGPNETSYTKAC